MIISINIPTDSSRNGPKFPPQLAKLGTEEVILIELQGFFKVEGNMSGQLAATLKIDENSTKPTMIIGHHLLEGKIVNLSKPLAVLEKKTSKIESSRKTGDDNTEIDFVQPDDENKAIVYDIVAVVKRKVLFSKRPMPVVNMANISSDTKSIGKS